MATTLQHNISVAAQVSECTNTNTQIQMQAEAQ